METINPVTARAGGPVVAGAALAALLACGLANPAAAEPAPGVATGDVIAGISREIAAAAGPGLEAAGGASRRMQILERAASEHTDFDYMSELVLGEAWQGAPAEQRGRFVSVFRTLLLRTYAQQVARYSHGETEFQSSRTDDTGSVALVNTRVKPADGPAVQVDYRLRQAQGRWKLFDVAVDGVSIITLFRASFANQAQRFGLDRLIEQLDAHNQRLRDT